MTVVKVKDLYKKYEAFWSISKYQRQGENISKYQISKPVMLNITSEINIATKSK